MKCGVARKADYIVLSPEGVILNLIHNLFRADCFRIIPFSVFRTLNLVQGDKEE